MVISYKKYFAIATLLPVIFVMACSAGPTKRYVDGKWDVSENLCSSNPEQPDLGDMRSEIRQYEAFQNSYSRKISFFHRDKTILVLSQSFDRGGSSGEMVLHENTSANAVAETTKIRNDRELNKMLTAGIEKFFLNDATIDGKAAHSFCLYRGQ